MDEFNWPAWLMTDGWAGLRRSAVIVVGETRTKYRVKVDGERPIRLAGRDRWLRPGETVLVPKHAVVVDHERG